MEKNMFDYLIKDGLLITEENNYKAQKVWIGIKDGLIDEISGREIEDTCAAEVIDASGCAVMPGMINGHCHGDRAFLMGCGDGLTLSEQNAYYEQTDYLRIYTSDDDRVLSRRKSYLDALCGGVTFICENMYWGMGLKSVEAFNGCGIRGALAEDIRVRFDEPQIFISDDFIKELTDRCRQADLVPIFGTLSEEDFDTELLKRVYAKRDEWGIRSTQHFAETDWRRDIVLRKYGMRPVEYLYKNGFLSDRLIGSHCVQVNDAEVDMMAESGMHVINTPLCEMKIADGIAPVAKYIHAGVNVGLGTDGAEWNNSSDLFREMKATVLIQSAAMNDPGTLSARDVLRMATIGGARAFGVDDRIGSIAKGKEADVVILDMNKVYLQPLRDTYKENVASTVVFNATAADVRDVFVKGRIELRDGEPVHVDKERLLSEVNALSCRVLQCAEEAEERGEIKPAEDFRKK